MKPTSPVSVVPKIGPKYSKLLEDKLEIKTVGDLLYHFPFRYEDFSQIKLIRDLMINDICTVKATLEKVDNVFTRNGKKFTKAIFADNTGKLQVVWYNQHYISNNLIVGTEYNLSGRVGSFNNKLGFVSPEIEATGKHQTNTGRLVPIYPETAGINSKWLRTRINDILNSGMEIQEFLPETIINRYNFLNLEKALNSFHFPQNEFDSKNAKKRFAYEELFTELLRVEGKKSEWKRNLKSKEINTDSHKQSIQKLMKSLPFALSQSQLDAIEEIFADIKYETPMNRLLEGDVGSGKTIVAVISSYLIQQNGYKTLYMAPTEILANQHHETFKKFLEPFGIKVGLKTGTAKNFDKDVDILIGTHALIFLEDKLDDIGLVIIDEQHRFGVEQRTKLLELGAHEKVPHLLTMTATPIPRTLALTLYGDLAISSLKAPENKKKNIKTWVLGETKRNDAFKWISEQNKPTFIVCPLIEQSEHESLENVKAAEVEFENLKKGVFKNKKVGLLHGRMKAKEKQEKIEDFKNGKIDILVSTPVIEVGVDIPDATIIVIESAERYGLASLHQLRGRVGRAGQEGFCLIFASNNSRTAMSRLKNLEKYDNGLELAEIDMKIRGQGDIYGTQQHGYIRFKVADFSDLELIEKVKKDVENYYPHLDLYPLLQDKLSQLASRLVHNS